MQGFKYAILVCTLLMLLSGCQLHPTAKGLPTLSQLQSQGQTAQQAQVEIRWKDQSFSFLLYQKQFDAYLQVLALTVSGQILFELHYDGDKVKVIERIAAMKYLPFDYVLRDILWGTLSDDIVKKQSQDLGLDFLAHDGLRTIRRQDQVLVQITQTDQYRQIDNFSVPYRVIITPISQDFFEQ